MSEYRVLMMRGEVVALPANLDPDGLPLNSVLFTTKCELECCEGFHRFINGEEAGNIVALRSALVNELYYDVVEIPREEKKHTRAKQREIMKGLPIVEDPEQVELED